MDSKNGLFLNINNVCLFWASTYSISESEILCMALVEKFYAEKMSKIVGILKDILYMSLKMEDI